MLSSLPLNQLTAYVFCATPRFSPPRLQICERYIEFLECARYKPEDEATNQHHVVVAGRRANGKHALTCAKIRQVL